MIAVVPCPVSTALTWAGGLRLGSGSTIGVTDDALTTAASLFAADVAADTGIAFVIAEGAAADTADVVLRIGSVVPAAPCSGVSPRGAEPSEEASTLVTTPEGVTVTGAGVEGVWRGLTTLRQMIATADVDGGAVVLPAGEVRDSPRYAWRGLSLDVVRTFLAPDQVRRVIDIMSLYKLNVLHLHLSDDQGWRFEVPGRPRLTDVGGAGAFGDRPGGHYTTDEYAALVRYAADRWITVVPEIDMPGHCGAAVRAEPDLSVGVADGAWPPANILDPDHPGVVAFARDVIGALADATPGPFLHIGGDEAFGMDADAYARFVDIARDLVVAAGKRPVMWQEGARSTTASGDLVQHWLAFGPALDALLASGDLASMEVPADLGMPAGMLPALAEMFVIGQADVTRAVEAGAQVILSPASHLYLDKPYAEPPTDPAQAVMQKKLGLRVYPRATVAETFDWDPGAALGGNDAAVAGVEACLWCETLPTGADVEFMLLPRLAGVAERAWSPAPVSTWDEYRERIAAHAPTWTAHGWTWFTSSLVDWVS